MTNFSTQIDNWTRKSLTRMDAVFKTAAQELAEKVQEPRAKGGLMPVDTGFLRNSFAGAVNSIPGGSGERAFSMQPITAAIMQARMGDRIVFGYGAKYAPHMESRYGFIRSNVQNWDRIVSDAVRTVRSQYR